MIRAFLLFPALLVLPAALHSECDYRPLSSDQFRVTAHDVAIDGDAVWVATSYGLNLHAAGTNELSGSIALPGPSTEVEQTAGLAYAGSGTTLFAVSRAGRYPAVVASLDLGATIHDLLYVAPRLWAATSAGVVPVDLTNAADPIREAAIATSGGGALTLAARDGVLYVADGDSTVEVIATQNTPMLIGSISSAGRAVSVSVANGWLFVSDGIQTEIFGEGITSLSRAGILPFGTGAVIDAGSDAVYTGGNDRRVRAIDLSSVPNPVTLFESELPASGGTVNRIEALSSDGENLYAAAGDLGLVVFEVRDFGEPYPIRHYSGGPYQSAAASGANLYLATAGEVEGWVAQSDGKLSRERQWSAPGATVHDASATPPRLLTSSGSTVTLWDTGSNPAIVSTATFRDTVSSAVLDGQNAFVVLADRSFWRADLSAFTGNSVIIPGTDAPSFVTKRDSALALAELNEDGTTTVRFFATGNPNGPASSGVIEGAATRGVEITPDGKVVAVTFRGISILDFGVVPPSVSVIPDSNRGPARGIAIAGDSLLVAGTAALDVWDLNTRTLRATFPLPPGTTAVASGDSLGFAAGSEGVTTVNLATASLLPTRLALAQDNEFHDRLRVGNGRMFLLGEAGVEMRALRWNGMPGTSVDIPASSSSAGLAVIDSVLFTLSVDGRVTARNAEGLVLAQFQMNEGPDADALSLHEANGALYLSLSRGCLSGGCEKKTLVLAFDGESLTQSASLTGALLDIATDGTRGYAIFEDPDEIRILDLADPLRPETIISRSSEGDPVSVDHHAGFLYTLGRRLFVYESASLEKRGELLDDYTADPDGRLTYLDQSIEIENGCAFVVGRTFAPQSYEVTGPFDWQLRESPSVPSAVHEVIALGPRVYLLTEHSVEVWTLEELPSRRRPAR